MDEVTDALTTMKKSGWISVIPGRDGRIYIETTRLNPSLLPSYVTDWGRHRAKEDAMIPLHQAYERWISATRGLPHEPGLVLHDQAADVYQRLLLLPSDTAVRVRPRRTVARKRLRLRNAINQRLRTRTATTRKARGHLDLR